MKQLVLARCERAAATETTTAAGDTSYKGVMYFRVLRDAAASPPFTKLYKQSPLTLLIQLVALLSVCIHVQ